MRFLKINLILLSFTLITSPQLMAQSSSDSDTGFVYETGERVSIKPTTQDYGSLKIMRQQVRSYSDTTLGAYTESTRMEYLVEKVQRGESGWVIIREWVANKPHEYNDKLVQLRAERIQRAAQEEIYSNDSKFKYREMDVSDEAKKIFKHIYAEKYGLNSLSSNQYWAIEYAIGQNSLILMEILFRQPQFSVNGVFHARNSTEFYDRQAKAYEMVKADPQFLERLMTNPVDFALRILKALPVQVRDRHLKFITAHMAPQKQQEYAQLVESIKLSNSSKVDKFIKDFVVPHIGNTYGDPLVSSHILHLISSKNKEGEIVRNMIAKGFKTQSDRHQVRSCKFYF